MSNVLSEQKKQQVIALGRLGWSLRRIERETGVRRETAAGYLKEAGIGIRPAGGWGRSAAKPANGPSADPDPKPANELTPGLDAESDAPQPTASACEPYRELIEEALSRGRNAKAIWQDLVDDHGFPASYLSVKRFVRHLCGSEKQPRAVIATPPGEEAQVDYGSGPMVRNPHTNRYLRTRLFVMTLGFSRKCVRLIVTQSSARTWAELHEIAFRRLGGVPRLIVLDNLREGVLKPDIYDPAINPLYRDVLAHYGATALPCRVGDPDRKGKVESSVGHAQKTPLKGQRFEFVSEAQAYLDRWEEHWADKRIHGTTKRQVAAMFAEEKPALLPLPLEPFRYFQYGVRSVNLDGCVEVGAAYYSAPPGWIGRRVNVQWDQRQVRLLDPGNGQLLREHFTQPRGTHRIAPEDRPRQTPLSTLQLLSRAGRAGKHIGSLCRLMHVAQGEQAVRRILGVLSLARKYGSAAVDQACSLALDAGSDYRFVRRYLESAPAFPLTLRQVDPLIRQLNLYRDVIEQRSQIDSEPKQGESV